MPRIIHEYIHALMNIHEPLNTAQWLSTHKGNANDLPALIKNNLQRESSEYEDGFKEL